MFLKDKKAGFWTHFYLLVIVELFKVSLVTYLCLYLLESMSASFVSNYFNINAILAIAAVSGVISVFVHNEEAQYTFQKPGIKEYCIGSILALTSAGIVYRQTRTVGHFSVLLAIVTVLIVFFSLTLLNGRYNEKRI